MAKRQQATAATRIRTCKSPDIVTVMRVKNESPYIARAIKSLLPLGGEIVILDDGSNDDTPDIIRRAGRLHYFRQDDLPMDEGRDRTRLLREALKLKPKWVFTLDGDEELDPGSVDRIKRAIKECPDDVNVFGILHAVMWGVPGGKAQFFAKPWIWNMDRFARVSAIKDKDYEFTSTFKNNLHCGCVPKMVNYKRQLLNAWVKCWGYESQEAVKKKLDFYEKNDPANYPNTRARALERIRRGIGPGWKDGPDARALGVFRTVTY